MCHFEASYVDLIIRTFCLVQRRSHISVVRTRQNVATRIAWLSAPAQTPPGRKQTLLTSFNLTKMLSILQVYHFTNIEVGFEFSCPRLSCQTDWDSNLPGLTFPPLPMIKASHKTSKEYFLSAFNVLDSVLWARGTGMNPHHCPVDAHILIGKAGREFLAEGTTLAKAVQRSSHECVQGTLKSSLALEKWVGAAPTENQGTQCVESCSFTWGLWLSNKMGHRRNKVILFTAVGSLEGQEQHRKQKDWRSSHHSLLG